jgi:CheY-like chemotaxis protein
VAITAYDSAHAQARAIDSGFQQYLIKPADPQDLIAALAALLPN